MKGDTENATDFYKKSVEAGIEGAQEKFDEITNQSSAGLQSLHDFIEERIKNLGANLSEQGDQEDNDNPISKTHDQVNKIFLNNKDEKQLNNKDIYTLKSKRKDKDY